ncbi:portal protein [Paenibacillus sp. S3N08]|uniref:Portal protein n=1 Tax=Paenibacillus agricola TaxID=2716264 RepID=A0ABX0J8H9_9BACL|nr:portal protein [Paenibacillus agricola]
MVGEFPVYESGMPDGSAEQGAINRIAEDNDLNTLIHESVVGAGIRGDSWFKSYYAPRIDVSEVPAGADVEAKPEPIIEAVDAALVFPELSRGSNKRFKAVNIAWIEWVLTNDVEGLEKYAMKPDERYTEVPHLVVERHVPGFILYERYRMTERGVDNRFGTPISTYYIAEKVATGRVEDVIETGVPRILVHHAPYKTVDDGWEGISGIEKLESVLAAINDRMVQIDYILWKHSDPTAYGPDLPTDESGGVRFGGKYIPVDKADVAPGYMTWNSQLDGAFKQLDMLLGIVYQMSETPQWLFGTTLASDKGGTGTSHTDSGAIKARFMPILSKVKRIRNYFDRAIRDAIWTAQELEVYANKGVDGFVPYVPQYPSIQWKDGIPHDDKEMAEVAQIRTGGKATWSVKDAIKALDDVDGTKADAIISRIDADEERVNGTVDASIFNSGGGA